MEKRQLKLDGIKQMLSRDEMKQIKGGSGGAGSQCCTFSSDCPYTLPSCNKEYACPDGGNGQCVA